MAFTFIDKVDSFEVCFVQISFLLNEQVVIWLQDCLMPTSASSAQFPEIQV